MRIALAQLNTSVGDIAGNAQLVVDWSHRAKAAGADLMVTPELALTGYPPQDLLYKPHFVTAQLERLQLLVGEVALPTLVGFVDSDPADHDTRFNAGALLADGKVQQVVHKTLLPTYDVFDEARYFTRSREQRVIDFEGLRLGVTICEDLWDEDYADKVLPALVSKGAQLVINLSASPFHLGKGAQRIALLRRHATEHHVPILYCNQVGAQDELIFDGDSLVVSAEGELLGRGRQFEEDLLIVEVGPVGAGPCPARCMGQAMPDPRATHGVAPTEVSELAAALTLGIRDYFRKCGFSRAVIGLSGGIDSAVAACLGAEALGADNVIGVAMPSRFNAPESTSDAELLAQNLGLEFHVLPIERSIEVAIERYTAELGDYRDGLTVENLQARERGKTLMEISNDRGALVLATGNKTEYALGYATLYGDMCGGLAVLGDVTKPLVYALARWFNAQAGRELIPQYTIDRPPSAELRSGQVDPFDYERISPLADLVIEDHLSRAELLARGYTAEEVELVLRLVRVSEYKRWQAPPVLRVTDKAFGIGRRMPLANGFRE